MKKKVIKWYLKLYNQKNWSLRDGDIVSLRWDRVKHGFLGDIILALSFATIGTYNNWGENLHFDGNTMWWLYYIIIPLLIAFSVGFSKEVYDKYKKNSTGFDLGDVWATMIPFIVYPIIKEFLYLFFRKTFDEIYDEILKNK